MPSLDISLSISLWWVIVYFVLGCVLVTYLLWPERKTLLQGVRHKYLRIIGGIFVSVVIWPWLFSEEIYDLLQRKRRYEMNNDEMLSAIAELDFTPEMRCEEHPGTCTSIATHTISVICSNCGVTDEFLICTPHLTISEDVYDNITKSGRYKLSHAACNGAGTLSLNSVSLTQ